MSEEASAERTGRLPSELSSLIGRRRELAELSALLEATRLLTLTGPGGAGKSRLALALAQGRRALGPTWWVDVASASDGAMAAQLVAAEVVPPRQLGEPAVEAIARSLGAGPALLVLDNCEHVADACAQLAAALLGACPELTILATSRQTLGVVGEQVWRVPGLAVPAPNAPGGEEGAVELFAERARRADPGFSLAGSRAAVIRICRRLDGIPLAIELAAARVPVLTPEQIGERLLRDSRLLSAGPSTAPARQRTLAATLDWSHRMLGAPEQAVFRRLSAFRGPFSLSACEAVGAGGDVRAADVLDALGRLVDQSLVQVAGGGEQTRYRLLETVRQYAAEKLAEAGERDAAHAAHAAFYLELAARAQPEQVRWLDQLEREHDNLRAALRRLLASAPEDGGRLAGLLWPFWHRRGHYQEARVWLEQAAALADRMSPRVRVGVLTGAGVLSFLQCDYAAATERLVDALALNDELGDRRGVAAVLQRLGSIAREQARYRAARSLHERSLAVWRELGDEAGVAASQDYLAFVAWLEGDFERAEEEGARALATLRASGREPATVSVLVSLGAAALYAGDLRAADRRLGEALALARHAGYTEGIAWSLNELGILARRRRDGQRSAALLDESLALHEALGDRWRIASVLEEIAGGALAAVDPHGAAELLGAAGALRSALGTPLPTAERPDHDAAQRALRRRLGTAALADAMRAGAERGLKEAIADAHEALHRFYLAGDEPPREQVEGLLTERERAVLALLSKGATNREIGAELFISPSTAGVHVSNILRKLGVEGRVQAAASAHRLGLLPSQEARQ
ncbi:MAG: LuxR C-terminal-related transcriptional regulator [Solirubrobacteraceae bacterium]